MLQILPHRTLHWKKYRQVIKKYMEHLRKGTIWKPKAKLQAPLVSHENSTITQLLNGAGINSALVAQHLVYDMRFFFTWTLKSQKLRLELAFVLRTTKQLFSLLLFKFCHKLTFCIQYWLIWSKSILRWGNQVKTVLGNDFVRVIIYYASQVKH